VLTQFAILRLRSWEINDEKLSVLFDVLHKDISHLILIVSVTVIKPFPRKKLSISKIRPVLLTIDSEIKVINKRNKMKKQQIKNVCIKEDDTIEKVLLVGSFV
jgi:hypothetical protein